MTDTDDIDERRARAIREVYMAALATMNGDSAFEFDAARAIRQSDEAAGYILVKPNHISNPPERSEPRLRENQKNERAN